MPGDQTKRLTLTAYDAEHVYDWLRMYWRGDKNRFGGCVECAHLGRRLERFIGPAAVRQIARSVKKYPGDTARPSAVARTNGITASSRRARKAAKKR